MNSDQRLGLNDALGYIKQACERGAKPFFFVVGAGVSNPPVKLAWQMVEDFKKEARKRHRFKEPVETQPIDIYSHWFSLAYRSPVERQDYIKRQIIGKFIQAMNSFLTNFSTHRTLRHSFFER